VLNGANVRPLLPWTQLWALVYARVTQTDGAAWRNLLLTRTELFAPHQANDLNGQGQRILYGEGLIPLSTLTDNLLRLGLPQDAPLTVLALEMFADPPEADPLGSRLGQERILRTSPLAPVPNAC
jgi:hypothetical protein